MMHRPPRSHLDRPSRTSSLPGALAAGLALAVSALLASGCCPHLRRDAAPTASPEPPMPDTSGQPAQSSLRPDIVRATLDNGLEIYMVEDHSAPLVSFQVWFKVGSSDEHEARDGADHGITGLSHFFEHMMFRGTEKNPDFFDQIFSLGGKLNAFTWLDETVYWENLPSQHLERVISMEADRLEHMKIDFLNLEPEREVVKSERLLRTVNRAEGRAWETLQARMFTTHPYHWKTIGWLPDLDSITVEEAQAYHDVYYAPNNAYIIVSGDHDPATTLELLKKYYGHLPKKDLPDATRPVEPPQTGERRDRVFKATDPQVVMWGYRAPAPRDPDFAVLEVIDHILTAGKSARLQKKLVYAKAPSLSRIYAYLFPIRDPYMYTWGANLLPHTRVSELEAVFDAEVSDIIANGVTDAELARAVAGLRSDLVRQNLSNQEKAEFMGFSIRATDDPLSGFDRLDLYGEITSADVKRVAAEVLRADHRTWVPVVNPARLTQLADQLLALGDPVPEQVAALTRGALAVVLTSQELEEQRADLAAEARALGHLERRAAHAREGADAETVAAIDEYLATNEKGFTKRKARLEAGQAEVAAAQAKIDDEAAALQKSLAGLARMRFDATRPPGGFYANVAQHVLHPAASDDRRAAKPLSASLGHGDAGLAPHRAGYHAMLAWVLDAQGQAAMATLHRAHAMKIAGDALAAEPAPPEAAVAALEAAHALAWDTQVTGKAATGPVRARATNTPQGGGAGR